MNLEDVAQRAGVSTATVSRVLNNIGVVRDATRERVLKAVEELKYYPNMHARALAAGSNRTIGIIVSNLENPFFLDVFRSLEAEANRNGYEVLVANTDYQVDRLKASVRLMIGRRLGGLALVVSEMDEALLEELAERKVPTVVYDVGTPRESIISIKVNYRTAVQQIAEYLFELGHRRYAFVGHHTTLGPLNDRRQTFVEVMEHFAPQVEFRTVADLDGLAGGRSAVRQIYQSGFRPTAIVCVNDFMALGVLRQLKDLGLRVPDDVSVTGFDGLDLSDVVSPALTTARLARDLIGHRIFESFTADAARLEEIRETLIQPELIVRESSGPVPVLENVH
jgi:DNA-binding LacI/PurR family transcriptional regulator